MNEIDSVARLARTDALFSAEGSEDAAAFPPYGLATDFLRPMPPSSEPPSSHQRQGPFVSSNSTVRTQAAGSRAAPLPVLPSASRPALTTIRLSKGRIAIDPEALRNLRHMRLMSQQDLADDCWRRNIQVSIATIKRAELGYPVRFRIARELARCFDVPVLLI